jgi:hypothetical protein
MAFSAVGVAMVCLPLWQVLQYQQSELSQLAAERALLDPVSRAVQVQFGLLAHRQVAAQLLQGQPQLEPARQAVQVGVDEQLLSLAQDLAQGLWSHALAETRDLTRDWQALARQVQARTLSAPQSEEAHALRVEQAVQVVDLVTLSDIVSGAGASTARLAAAARTLTRMASDMPTPALTAQPAVELASAQARLQSRLVALQQALAAAPAVHAAAGGAIGAGGALRPAMAEVERSTRQLLALQPGTGTVAATDTPALSAQRAEAWRTAQKAQLNLFNQALGQHKRMLSQRQGLLQRQQMALLAALALLSAAALALAAGLARQLGGTADPEGEPSQEARAAPAAQPAPAGRGHEQEHEPPFGSQRRHPADGATWFGPVAGQAASPTRVEAVRLLDRLRGGTEAGDAPRPARHRESNDTLPPERS